MSQLLSQVFREIAKSGGRISFAAFMDLALYHPQWGYYAARGRPKIGRAGDFFTSVSVGPLFGRILARQFVAFREDLGNPADFTVMEFGGHHGELRADVLAACPDLTYRVKELADPWPDPLTGCIFSNEFLDALPVHRVRVVDGQWREIYVVRGPDEDTALAEEMGPLSTPRLVSYLEGLPVSQMEGYQTEINVRALDWIEIVSRLLVRGFVLTIDYGYTREDLFAPHHRDGTLHCYHRHTQNADPYVRIGEQDITAHVDFSALIEHGRKFGLEPVAFTDQAHYLLDIGKDEIAKIVSESAGQISKERAAIHQLIHPEMMGRAFKVLVQRKT